MATSTINTKEAYTAAQPMEHQMWERRGFDRRGIRREFAGVQSIDLGDKRIEQDDRTVVDPRSLDMPVGPTGMGEVGGSGVEMFRVDGESWPTYRWTQGFTMLAEDDTSDIQMQRDAVIEMFDFFSDAAFLTGLGSSGQYAEGAFDWLRNAIPSKRTFDATNFASDSSYDGKEENLIFGDAYESVSGELLNDENAQWDMMVGSQSAIAKFNRVSGSQGGVAGDTYWQRLSHEDAVGGISDYNLVPEKTQPTNLPRDLKDELNLDELVVDLVDESTAVKSGGSDDSGIIGNDEIFLLPDMGTVRDEWFNTYEMSAPETFEPVDLRGGKTAFDYATRYTQRHNPNDQYQDALDAIHIQNVSELFN